MTLVFSLLGPLQVSLDERPLTIAGPRSRRVLATLLLEAGRVVPVAGLTEAVWDDPPATAREQLQNVAAALRRAGMPVARTDAGFVLEPGPGTLIDVREFARLRSAAEASDDPGGARQLLGQALELWRGPVALAGLEGRILTSASARLEQDRLDCVERALAADLQLGRHARACAELAGLVARYPLRERLVELHMLALYRSGRRGEALAAFTLARRRLAAEAGLDPGPALRALHAALLSDTDPGGPAGGSPAGGSPADLAGPGCTARRGGPQGRGGTAEPGGGGRDTPATGLTGTAPAAPAQLPAPVAELVGRDDEVAALRRGLREGGGAVCVVTGTAGIGKTALALTVGRALREDFPDGQLYVDLRGADPTAGADPAEVLAGFLRGLGVDGPAVPAEPGERGALYRSLLAGRRVLVVLDNAASEAQVRPLLPGSGPALVTSRHRLAALDRRTALTLPLLDEPAALGLLARVAGAGRIAAEADSARELVRLCGGLPLALRIVGAELATLPHRELARLAARLADERARLDVLDGVRAGLRLSCRALPAEARALLRGLALLDAPDYASWTAAAVLNSPLATAESALDALVAAHLLEATGSARYRMHDLVRAFGRELPGAQEAVPRRVLACWVALVREGRRAHQGVDYPGSGGRAAAAVPDPAVLAGPRAEPVRWLGAEREALVATVRQAARVDPYACVELAAAGEYLFDLRSDLPGWQALQEAGLAAARAGGDRAGEALMLVGLGRLRACREEWGPARAMVEAGEALFEGLGDAHGAAYAGWVLSYLDRVQGRLDEAARRCRRGAAVFEAAGDRYGQAHALRGLGQVLLARGETGRALELLRQALAVAELGGADWPRMCMLRWVADAQRMLGRSDEATAGFREVLAHTERSGDLAGQSAARIGLGRIALDRGDTAGALRELRAADELGRRSGQILVRAIAAPPLARALLASGDAATAGELLEEALADCRRMNAAPLLARLESALADVRERQ
ncbi:MULTISPECIES: BTAD domain-containing putative transcriptional regulator [unclassified Streptomyces]|uniref:AfsR/SARP family transcriptional regulator n=1 Tax=unclassified Streptomyces TaxID=2593676 RepID=UPI002252874F|nr:MULTISPECIES: BTAD domain-containing putative transcriptional regulator [unclassified Streptomyces]MCX4528228.1 AfsR/SARP family transcriptional regulator [Streptomyces sp. NBC_01551]MCX4541172.1 AfsR/SARP family transcriptional regulator [Streptomyces sp. NBC_01565]